VSEQKFIVIAVAGEIKGFGLMAKGSYDAWNKNQIFQDIPDAFALLYGNCPLVDTYDTWDGVMQSLKDCNGEIADVICAIAY
jgi:hypothetical protein